METKHLFGTLGTLPNDGVYPAGITKKIVFGPNHHASGENFVVRAYSFGPGMGPKLPHEHPWCHWSFVQSGEAVVSIDGNDQVVPAGGWFHIPGGVPHTVYNNSPSEPMVFLCIVHPEGDVNPPVAAPVEKDKSFC
jgi:Uncharacterized conserved protein, contains double-stranded beta-helix domain